MRYYAAVDFLRNIAGLLMQKLLIIITLIASLWLTACSKFHLVHKIDVQQGNVITEDKVNLLEPGMTRRQVQFIMGSPMIADVFHHPDFEKISMKGRVKNLKNVYRTPSNISRCAFDILSHDTKLNAYYRKSYYLKDSFLSDIRFILEDGRIVVDDYEEFTHLNELLDRFDEKDDVVVLTQHTKMAGRMNDYMKKRGWHHIRAMTFQSIKGLEAQHIVLHDFDKFLETAVKYEEEILFRKVYVLFTRARESLYISLPSDYRSEHEKIQTVLDTIERHTKKIAQERPPEEDAEIPTLSKLAPQVENYKKSAELVVLTAEFFGVVAGLFGA